ncbi:MAG: hypothetical protein AAGG51_01720 [Cyanobacteria bacterium P01_G01_bin.54]
MNIWQTASASLLLSLSSILPQTAQAAIAAVPMSSSAMQPIAIKPLVLRVAPIYDTYRAGDYTITISNNQPETGYTYRGCDRQNRCIDLQHGTSWYDGRRRGITWENGNYYYAVSWRNNNRSNSMILMVYHGDTVLLQAPMLPVVES